MGKSCYYCCHKPVCYKAREALRIASLASNMQEVSVSTNLGGQVAGLMLQVLAEDCPFYCEQKDPAQK